MRTRLGIGSGWIALAAAVLALGGCGGSSYTTDRMRTAALSTTCDVSEIEGALSGLEAGISGTEREFAASGRNERQILRAMKTNAASIRGQLPKLEDCARNALLEAEGKPVRETTTPRPTARHTVLGHQLGSARVEPGEQLLPASPCGTPAGNGTMTAVHIFSDAGHCVRVRPSERLLFVNDTGIGPQHEGATAIRVLIGSYELWIGPRESGLIPAPVENYLGRGSHRVRVSGAPGATILVLPPACAIRAPVPPGGEPCFH